MIQRLYELAKQGAEESDKQPHSGASSNVGEDIEESGSVVEFSEEEDDEDEEEDDEDEEEELKPRFAV